MKQQFLKDIGGTIRLQVYDKNRNQIPTGATITIYKSDGSTLLQATDTGQVDVITGEMTYAITAAIAAQLGMNYKAVWQYVIKTNTYNETQLFDVVRSILSIPITDF